MIFVIIVHLFGVFINANEQQQDSQCSESSPFRLIDNACASFNEMCYKKGDEQCNQLLNACKQCPPSNITSTILQDMLKFIKINVSSRLENVENKIKINVSSRLENVENKIKNPYSPSVENKDNAIYACLIAIIILLIIIIIILLVENRFKFITKYVQSLLLKENSKYKSIHSRKWKYQNDTIETVISNSKELKDMNQKAFKDLKEIVMKISSEMQELQNIQIATIKFIIEGINREFIELYVNNNQNIVQVKQQICAELTSAKQDDYKIMQLKYNGIILDDNEYLLKYINSSNATVNCIIDSTINASEIVVVKLKGKIRVRDPDIIQISKHENIAQLKKIIAKIINYNEFVIFRELIEDNKMLKLEENHTVDYYNLMDGDLLNVITIERGELVIKSIFDENVSCIIKYFNTDLISSLAEAVKRNFQPICQDVILFLQNNKMIEENFVFQLQIRNESPVKFCGFMEYEGIQVEDKSIEMGAFWELYKASNTRTKKKILIKKYKLDSAKDWKNDEHMLKELKTFQITKFNRRFIQLLGVCNEDRTLYVVMENMAEGTLKKFLKKSVSLEKNEIYKWSAQILEGLKFLHEHKVVHRDLNPSSILVDESTDLKLSSFNLSKYEAIYGRNSSIHINSIKSNQLKVRYMAPEILSKMQYGKECDVWSFGAVLIKIVSRKKPYHRISKQEAINKIKNSRIIEYEFSNKSLESNFKSFVDSCLKSEPNQRATIEKLIENEYIKPFISNINTII